MAHQKRLAVQHFGLRAMFQSTFAISIVLAIGIYTDWYVALLGAGVPVFAWHLLILSVKAKSDDDSRMLAKCSSIVLAIWAVFLVFPFLILRGGFYVSRYLF